METANLKRRRPDESHDEDLYFEDGSVVISAADVDENLLYFRVHKSILSKQSAFFKDMFSLPTVPTSEEETYDGLPLVHVHDDAKEFKQFLQAIYDPSFLPFLRSNPHTLALVLGPLKLAKKYLADVLRDRITAHLAEDCPTILEDWDSVAYSVSASTPSLPDDGDDTQITQSPSDSGPADYLTKDFIPDPISFLELARVCELPSTFATLSYLLCRDSPTQKKMLSRMTRVDLETLLLGKDRMMHFVSKEGVAELEIDSWIPEYYGDSYNHLICTDPGCHTALFKVWAKVLEDVMCYGDPLAIFRMAILKYRKEEENSPSHDEYRYGERRDDICFSCKYRLENNLEAFREHLFDNLPTFFPLQENKPQMADSED